MLRSHLDSYNQGNCHFLKSKKGYVIYRGTFEYNGNSGGGEGGPRQPPWKRNSWGEGEGAKEKTFRGGYGYFLELHIIFTYNMVANA